MKNHIEKLKELIKKRKKESLAVLITLMVALLIVASFKQGSKPLVEFSEVNSEAPKALETSFDKWSIGEDGEIVATFLLNNHTKETISLIDVRCASFAADGSRLKEYKKRIKIELLPNEVRRTKIAIGEMDKLTQKTTCIIENWE